MKGSICSIISRISLIGFIFGLATLSAFAGDNDWRPVSPEELAQKTPKVEADADAEALFWEVRVDDSSDTSLSMKHYIRVKIFTDRGREKFSKVDIPYVREAMKIKNLEGRVIKPDGSIILLAKTDIIEREITKTDDIKIKAKSFAVPNLEAGSIFEYRYQEYYEYGSADDMKMLFQRDIPLRSVSYYFRPAGNAKYFTYNMADNKFIKEKNGYYRATMENVPALKEEAFMPPEDEVRSWILLYYQRDLKQTSTDFWSRYGGLLAYSFEIKDTLKPSKDLKAAAEQITAGAANDEERVRNIFDFCKTKIKSITYDAKLTDDDKEKIKPNKSTTDTYKKLQGTRTDINELFASLITAAGLEARLAFSGDRSEKFFDSNQAHESFIHFAAIAVRLNGKWRYFDPGDYFTPYGMLPWFEEDTDVLLLSAKDFITTKTTFSDVEKSVSKRTGKFTLSEDGTLEGDVKIEYTGHLSYRHKMANYKDSFSKQEETLKEMIKEDMSAAEISAISIENTMDPQKPFTYQFKVRVPNYAQKTGKRLFLQPGFFEYGSDPVFASTTRKYPIFFSFPWSEEDNIEISLPKGYMLDNAEAPASIADPDKISSLTVNIGIAKDQSMLSYKRRFYFGGSGRTYFPAAVYAPVKSLFDAFHKTDSHTITLKQADQPK